MDESLENWTVEVKRYELHKFSTVNRVYGSFMLWRYLTPAHGEGRGSETQAATWAAE